MAIYSVHKMNRLPREDALTLEILEAIAARSDVTQRYLARRAGVALGLANAYLKRCVRKGLIKIRQAPANRYLYYVTPQGFAEKSRLTAEYLSYSLQYMHKAGDACAALYAECEARGWSRVVLAGCSDLGEIAVLRALEHPVQLIGVFDPAAARTRFLNLPCVSNPTAFDHVDAWILTDLSEPQAMYESLLERSLPERVLVPDVVMVRTVKRSQFDGAQRN